MTRQDVHQTRGCGVSCVVDASMPAQTGSRTSVEQDGYGNRPAVN